MLKPTHYLLSACLAFAVTTLTDAATPAISSVNTTGTNTASTINHPPATDSLQQLRSIQQQIQLDLNQSRQQNEQLQTRLSELNQQIASLQHNQPQSPQDVAQIQQLQTVQQQIQRALVTLSQQNSQLQQRLNQLEQTITQLQTTAMPQTTPPLTLTPATAVTPTTHAVSAPTPPPSTMNTHAMTQPQHPKAVNQTSRLKTQLEQWAKNPAFMLRLGIGFIGVALLLLIALFWPKRKSRQQENIEEVEQAEDVESESTESAETTATVEQSGLDTDLMNEYDFLNSDTAIPIRLDLARAYIQMGRYQEARDAIEPVFTKGNDAEHQEAQELLQQIAYAEQGAAVEA